MEFTIEPFVEGAPGPHVLESFAAVRALGLEVEVGPFGSGVSGAAEQVAQAAATVIRVALANGATHVNVHVSTGGAEST